MCVWEEKGRCFSFTHVEVELYVDYPEKSRLELEVQAEFLAVANQLSTPGPSPHSTYTTLLLHAFQATFGPHCDLPGLHCRLQVCAWGPGLSSAPSQQKFSLLPFGARPDTLAPLTLSEVAGALTSLRGLCSAGS